MNKKNLMLEQLPISDKLRTEVYKEIGTGELIRWAGQPIPLSFIESNFGNILYCIGSTFFSLYLGSDLLRDLDSFSQDIFSGILFLLMTLFCFFVAFYCLSTLIESWKEREVERVYLITNQRAIKISCGIKSCFVRSYPPSELKDIFLRERKDGSGDIVFGYDSFGDDDFYSSSSYYIEWGFMKIRNVREVEKMLRHLAQNGNDDTYN